MAKQAAIMFAAIVLTTIGSAAHAAETDQFLTWEVVLADSTGPLNTYLNEQAHAFLENVNNFAAPIETAEALTIRFYEYLFQGLHSSRIRTFVNTDPHIDRYPNREVSFLEYQRMSIYRKPAFPYILPMARTVRIGNVYLGTDKIGHFFGFGRRYFQRFLRHRDEERRDPEAAMRKVVQWGIAIERSLVGGLVDGIFSYADLEANFQGFQMALDCAEGDNPYFQKAGGKWVLTSPFDLRDYITPGFDESYNVNHYQGLRKRQVLPILEREYCKLRDSGIVQRRFGRYELHEPSFSQQVIKAHYDEKDTAPQEEQSLHNLCPQHQQTATRPFGGPLGILAHKTKRRETGAPVQTDEHMLPLLDVNPHPIVPILK
ncbi:MAG: hypothetical protein ACLFTT_01135 [Candidatus Hydrogenedentota bacterium]